MSRAVEEAIGQWARVQHGLVTRGQLLSGGLSQRMIDGRLRSGRLRRVHRGVYSVSPVAQPREAEMAAILACGPRAVVGEASAARVWGIDGASQSVRPVMVLVEGGSRARRPGIAVRRVRRLGAGDVTVVDRIPITTPARTILDLGRTLATRDLEEVIARAERRGLVTRAGLTVFLERHAGQPGARVLRSLILAPADWALTRSVAEQAFLEAIRRVGLPEPELNVLIGPYEADALWRRERVAVEVDGFTYHSSRRSFENDRRRDAWFAARGIRVIRFTWRQIVRESARTMVMLAQALARADVERAPGGQGIRAGRAG